MWISTSRRKASCKESRRTCAARLFHRRTISTSWHRLAMSWTQRPRREAIATSSPPSRRRWPSEAIVKLVTAVSGHLLEQGDTVDAALSAALDALNGSIGMSASALTVTTGSGAPLLQIGQVEAFQRSGDAAVGFRLAILRRMPNQYNLSLVVTPTEGRRVTRHQRDVADAFVNLVDAWVRRILPQLQGRDRRTASRRFDEVLDRFAGQALERGIPVAVVVLFVTDAACFPRLTQQWIAKIRGTMRGSDIVGMLGEGEIGLLLHET